ncbi:MAG: hypothetical protein ACK5OC_01470 [Pirellula sp.]
MTDKIPEFDENGLLPVGDYEVTLAELRTSILVQGPRDRIKYPSWDAIDGYFVCNVVEIASGRLVRALNRLDPQKVWTWDPALRRAYPGYPKKQLPMWHVYRVELYPHFPGLSSGIRDKFGNELEFPAAFRQCRRDSTPKGIVKLKREIQS